jgi:hypothetical protein
VGLKTHIGYNQEPYDAECAALARALETAARRQTTPGRVTIFTDAQAAIKRMASEEPIPGQFCAIQARIHIVALRRARPGMIIIEMCPAPRESQETRWPTSGPDEPDAHGVEWLQYSDRTEVRPMPLPKSLAYLKREISEKKWVEARRWTGGQVAAKKYKLPREQRLDITAASSSKRLASRFYQLKTGHCLTGQ